MLSAKAKGKQRATEFIEDEQTSSSSSPRTLVVRFTEGDDDLTLEVTEQDTVRDVKIKVCSLLESAMLGSYTKPVIVDP
jgi:hypothetical protein